MNDLSFNLVFDNFDEDGNPIPNGSHISKLSSNLRDWNWIVNKSNLNQMKTVKLTEQELEFIKTGTLEYNKIKMNIGEYELQKQNLVLQAEKIREAFSNNEKILIEKYGNDSVINMQTGEVTQKEK